MRAFLLTGPGGAHRCLCTVWCPDRPCTVVNLRGQYSHLNLASCTSFMEVDDRVRDDVWLVYPALSSSVRVASGRDLSLSAGKVDTEEPEDSISADGPDETYY